MNSHEAGEEKTEIQKKIHVVNSSLPCWKRITLNTRAVRTLDLGGGI